jgi:FkbM family methyltransferase
MYTSFHGEGGQHHGGKTVDERIREYFPNYDYKGVFFEIGAWEPIMINNSYHFEKNGWDCYLFEANTELIPLLKEHRKNVFNYAISNTDKESVLFNVVVDKRFVPSHPKWTASYSAINIAEEHKNIWGWDPLSVTQIPVPQRTLNTVITNDIPEVKKIDVLTLDIEGGELDCLYGMDLNKCPPSLMVIENVTNDKRINDYLSRFGYVLHQQIAYNQYYLSNEFVKSRSTPSKSILPIRGIF